MSMFHVLESNDSRRKSNDNAPQRYYAADYPIGASVDHNGVTYDVRNVENVVMFVAR
jgi:hypothetical protein